MLRQLLQLEIRRCLRRDMDLFGYLELASAVRGLLLAWARSVHGPPEGSDDEPSQPPRRRQRATGGAEPDMKQYLVTMSK